MCIRDSLKALYDHRVTSYQLEKVKFDTPVLKLQELKEMGIIVTPKELEAMKMCIRDRLCSRIIIHWLLHS